MKALSKDTQEAFTKWFESFADKAIEDFRKFMPDSMSDAETCESFARMMFSLAVGLRDGVRGQKGKSMSVEQIAKVWEQMSADVTA